MDFIDVGTYGRNSDKRQDTSQGIQSDIFADFASSPTGFTALFGKPAKIVENYKDDGKSASKKKGKRADFSRMLDDVASGKRKVILVLNTSRFSRLHPVDTLKFLGTFRDSGACLVSIEDKKIIDVEDLGSLITNLVKFNSDHEYSRSLAANVLRGTIRSIKTAATAHVSLIPFGMSKLVITDTGEERVYARTQNIRLPETWNGYLVPGDTTEVEVVRWIYATYLGDDVSCCWIAQQLNQHENPAVRAGYSGRGWDDCRIKKILTNRHYRGQEFIGADTTKGEHYCAVDGQAVKKPAAKGSSPLVVPQPAAVIDKYGTVIDPDTFEAVQRKLLRKKGSKPKTSGGTKPHALTGSLVCGHCGNALIASGGDKFVCKAYKSGKTACRCWGVHESEVLPWLVNRIDKEVLKGIGEQPEEPGDTSAAVKSAIAAVEKKIDNIKATLAAMADSPEACRSLADVINKLVAEKDSLYAQLREGSYQDRLDDLRTAWEEVVRPELLGLRTGNFAEEPIVSAMGLDKLDVERHLDWTYTTPTRLRELLQSMDCRVTCFFKSKEPGSRSSGKRQHHQLDHGQVTVTIQGQTTRLQPRDMPHQMSRLLSLVVSTMYGGGTRS
jgi:hypothetical protein